MFDWCSIPQKLLFLKVIAMSVHCEIWMLTMPPLACGFQEASKHDKKNYP